MGVHTDHTLLHDSVSAYCQSNSGTVHMHEAGRFENGSRNPLSNHDGKTAVHGGDGARPDLLCVARCATGLGVSMEQGRGGISTRVPPLMYACQPGPSPCPTRHCMWPRCHQRKCLTDRARQAGWEVDHGQRRHTAAQTGAAARLRRAFPRDRTTR